MNDRSNQEKEALDAIHCVDQMLFGGADDILGILSSEDANFLTNMVHRSNSSITLTTDTANIFGVFPTGNNNPQIMNWPLTNPFPKPKPYIEPTYSSMDEYFDDTFSTEEDKPYLAAILTATNVEEFRSLVEKAVDSLNKNYVLPLQGRKIAKFTQLKLAIMKAQELIGKEAISWQLDNMKKICTIDEDQLALLTPPQVVCLLMHMENVWMEDDTLPSFWNILPDLDEDMVDVRDDFNEDKEYF